jgi:uncharacterized protein YcbX
MIGRVVSLHRYPVKSMAGEALDTAQLGLKGVRGDRGYALIDRESGKVVSAKRPRRYPRLLEYGARFVEPPAADGPLPPVVVTCPDGTTSSSAEGAALDELLSSRLGRPVSLTATPPERASFEYHWPDQPGLWYKGRLYRDEVSEHEMPPGTFFDGAMVHLVTTASLAELATRARGSGLQAARFRPNIVMEATSTGFVENDWAGRVVRIGNAVRAVIVKPCIRCVMVNLAQVGVDPDPAVLGAAFEHNGGNVGVKVDVLSAGAIAVGDPVTLEV